jgi:hypothetical protein
MASLTGNLISDSYSGLLKTTDNGTITSVTKSITDGLGNATALSLSTTSASIAGNLTINGTLNATASSATTASYALTTTTASFAISASSAVSSSFAISADNAVSSSFAVTASNANFLDGLDSTAFAVLSGSNVITGSITLSGRLSFNAVNGNFVFPSQPALTPATGSAYFSGSSLYIYNGVSYLSVALA